MKLHKASNPAKTWPQDNPLRWMYLDNPKSLSDSLQVRRLMWQIINGLKFLHDNGIIH